MIFKVNYFTPKILKNGDAWMQIQPFFGFSHHGWISSFIFMWNEKLNFKDLGFIQAYNSMSNYTVVLV